MSYQSNISTNEFLSLIYTKMNFLIDNILDNNNREKNISKLINIFYELQKETKDTNLIQVYNNNMIYLLSRENKNINKVKKFIEISLSEKL